MEEDYGAKVDAITTALLRELNKFSNGNKAAGTRARALCLEMKDLMSVIRKAIQSAKSAAKGA
jgi:hypothetical protein